MKDLRTRLRHWWQRNFGHVYLSEDGVNWVLVRASFGKVTLWDGYFDAFPLPCKLSPTGWVQHKGHNTKYQWRYNPSRVQPM